MKRSSKWLWTMVFTGIIILLILVNCRLYYQPKIENGVNITLKKQLAYLNQRRDNGASDELQKLYPEGKMFFEVLYGLSWVELMMDETLDSLSYLKGLKEVEKSLSEISSNDNKKNFQSNLNLSYGAFYNGWYSYLLGNRLRISNRFDSTYYYEFVSICDEIEYNLNSSSSPYLESYRGQSWPADMTVCIASLALHDKLFGEKYKGTIDNWIFNVKQLLDPNGLIPHSADVQSGETIQNARGASQSLILSFLPDIDSTFAHSQYLRFKELFVRKRLGLNAVGEFPENIEGTGDIDSGPVIWGIGTAATIVAPKAAIKNNDIDLAFQLRNVIEAFGFPLESTSSKKYLFGLVDIGDAFIAWSSSSLIVRKGVEDWRRGFQIRSLIMILFMTFLIYSVWKLNLR